MLTCAIAWLCMQSLTHEGHPAVLLMQLEGLLLTSVNQRPYAKQPTALSFAANLAESCCPFKDTSTL